MVLLACAASLSLLAACDRSATVQLRFKLDDGSAAVRRLQFYLFDIELLQNDGTWRRFTVTPDQIWQDERVALLDLKGSQGDRRFEVVGGIPQGSYTGVRFSVGVPFDLNHVNQLTASAPLNRAEMFWSWQSGYKFLRVELTDEQHAGAFHLGSTGCSSASALRPPREACAQPNVVRVELLDFDPLTQPIEVRVAGLVSALQRSPRAACTGEYDRDPACGAAFVLTGLDLASGVCSGASGICASQRLFAAP
jgi:uncharacterized repeat protein (TIGR04052 family)